jgi:two-component system, OmpR family, response regulator
MNDPAKILLVEDEPDIQLITRLALEKIGGYVVLICGSGGEALQSAPAFMPDLILLDNMMPGMDGVDTMKALRALPALSKTPIVFLTANNDKEIRQELIRKGALDVIFKPFEPHLLIEQIRAIWQRRVDSPQSRRL